MEFPDAQLFGANYWDTAAAEIAKIVEGPMKGIGHACEAETALMLAVRPDLVRRHAIHNDLSATRQPKALSGVYVVPDMKAQTEHGGIGYAELATAEKGALLMEVIVARLVEVVQTVRHQKPPAAKRRRK